MKNSLLRKIICWILLCLMVQPTFGQEASIMLYYKPGITNVSFKYNGTHDSLNPISVNTEEYSDSTIVKITENNMGAGKKSDLSSYATEYVNNLQLFNHMVGLDTQSITPGQLNFWVNGSLFINGKEAAPLFSLGMLAGYWWYGSRYGNRYIGNNDLTDKGLDITDISGASYCLKEPSSNSDELFVYNSSCSEAGGNYAPDSGKDKQQSFSFVYGSDIKSINFDVVNNQSEDGSGHKLSNSAIQTDNQGSLTKVTVTAGEIGSLGTANAFNAILGYINSNMDMSHILQLMPANDPEAHKPVAAVKQNLWLTGKLKIDGQPVKGILVLGHNSETNTNWWVGSTNGTRYDSPSNSGLNVVGANDNQAYCINSSQTNYQAVITKGVCNDYSPSVGKIASPVITFGYGSKTITSVSFIPEQTSDKKNLISEDGMNRKLPYPSISYMSSVWLYNTKVAVTAGTNGSYGTAKDFSKLLGIESSVQMTHSLELMDRRQESAHEPRLAQNMNSWVKGKLKIESYTVSENFIIGHSGGSDKNWWIGSPDGTRFDSPTNSGLNMQYFDSKEGITHHYCLNQSNNHAFVVSDGVCTPVTVDPRVDAHHPVLIKVLILAGTMAAMAAIGGIGAYMMVPEGIVDAGVAEEYIDELEPELGPPWALGEGDAPPVHDVQPPLEQAAEEQDAAEEQVVAEQERRDEGVQGSAMLGNDVPAAMDSLMHPPVLEQFGAGFPVQPYSTSIYEPVLGQPVSEFPAQSYYVPIYPPTDYYPSTYTTVVVDPSAGYPVPSEPNQVPFFSTYSENPVAPLLAPNPIMMPEEVATAGEALPSELQGSQKLTFNREGRGFKFFYKNGAEMQIRYDNVSGKITKLFLQNDLFVYEHDAVEVNSYEVDGWSVRIVDYTDRSGAQRQITYAEKPGSSGSNASYRIKGW